MSMLPLASGHMKNTNHKMLLSIICTPLADVTKVAL